MKVLIWCCGFDEKFAGQYIYTEAKRQGLDVEITGSRPNPSEMLVALERYKPDWVFCLSLTAQCVPIYRKIRATGAKLLFWYPDQTETIRDNWWKKRYKGEADVCVFAILDTAIRYAEMADNVLWIPQYFDDMYCRDSEGKLPERLDPKKEIYDVCFIGSVDDVRRDWLMRLEQKYKCAFYVNKNIRGYKMAEVYAQSKIAINIQRELFQTKTGLFVTSNRMYNAMGSGCFFINHFVKGIDNMFGIGVHLMMHNDTFEDLDRHIKHHLLSKFEIDREIIALTGKRQILRYHTLSIRIQQYWRLMNAVDSNDLSMLRYYPYIKYTNWGGKLK